jgi:hypothetical protein
VPDSIADPVDPGDEDEPAGHPFALATTMRSSLPRRSGLDRTRREHKALAQEVEQVFRFPPDARWNADQGLVALASGLDRAIAGIPAAEYERRSRTDQLRSRTRGAWKPTTWLRSENCAAVS